jgi:transposase
MEWTAGIDLASAEHRLCVVDEEGCTIEGQRIAHDERGLSFLCRHLSAAGVQRVALEQPNGLVVDRLLEAGLTVVPVHPNQLAAARDRYRAGGGKSDGFDSYVLAELARTDMHRLRPLQPDGEETRALRALTRAREDLVQQRVALANQLRSQLESFWPGAGPPLLRRRLADLARLPGALPEPRRRPRAGREAPRRLPRPQRLLRAQEPQGALGAAAAGAPGTGRRARARGSPRGGAGAGGGAAPDRRADRPPHLAARRRPARAPRPLFRDRKTVVCPAALIAEIGDCRARYPSADALAADGGQCPVAIESGKRKVATFRRACDKRLRTALATLADSTRHWHPWAAQVYRDAIARGHDHPHAIRILGRAWCRVLWRCWQDATPYDPTRHGNLKRLLAARG